MPVTSVDIPEELLNFIDTVIEKRFARSRKEVILRAIEIYARFEANAWNGSLITINGIRNLLISKGSLSELMSRQSDSDLYDTGKRMGKTLRDVVIQRRLDPSRLEDRRKALQVIGDEGWGKFEVDQDRITVTGAIVPAPLIHGYLETALSLKLSKLDTTEDVLVFEKKRTLASGKS
jgi:Arc/MetJ-type ribon-helix-helix transcriptional regulator